MLLKTLFDCTPRSFEKERLEYAWKKMKAVSEFLNSEQRRAENAVILNQLQARLLNIKLSKFPHTTTLLRRGDVRYTVDHMTSSTTSSIYLSVHLSIYLSI